MVQRKVAGKFGIQADHSSHDHISLKKPSSSQHQDGKNRLPDLKKKVMKKSRSFKLSDIGHQSLKSSTPSALIKNDISQPGKPPPTLDVSTILLTQEKQTPTITKTVESSPNYMKSTSCFDARKEPQSSQVSLRRNSTDSRVVSSPSNDKRPAKKSTKTSSSNLVRTLIKTPSFKPSRPASKKSPRVALCTSDDHLSHVQRATCSSTLKDSKFPSYLMLNQGGTESEGTSVMKVCPYTYCSLNGHHHASLPPLKRFLSARRRSLKNQKSFKLAVPFDKAAKEIDEEDAAEKVGTDFFVEIYANKTMEDDKEKTEFLSSKGGEEEEEDAENYLQVQAVESLSVGSPQSDIDTDESPERYSEAEAISTETGIIENFHEEEEANNYYMPVSDEEMEGSDSDMEWEEAPFSEVEIEDEADNWIKMDDESEPILGFLLDDIAEDDGKEAREEESACFEGDFAEELNSKIEGSGQMSDGLMVDQLSSTEDGFEDLSGNEEYLRLDEQTESMHASMDATSEEEQVEERIKESEDRNVVSEAENVINLTEVIDEDPSNNPKDDETSSQVCDASEDGKQDREESLETDKQVNNGDFSFKYGDGVNVSEEIPSPDPSQAKSEANQVVTKVEEGSGNIEILDHNVKTHMTTCDHSVDRSDLKRNESEKPEDSKGQIKVTEMEIRTKPEKKPALLRAEQTSDDKELRNKRNRSKRGNKDLEEESTRDFNPREPNYLPLVAEPEGEKVDLRHQMMDERKNSEEWMIDYALQQTVTKLAPAKKKKVALLVEAFEAVMPVAKCESGRFSRHHHHHHPHSQAFPQAIRPIQTCS